MANGFFRERKHYKIHDIAKELNNISIEEAKRLVGILKKYGVVKAVKASKPEYEDLSNADIILTDVVENNDDIKYVFDFVGVIMLEQQVFKCYPKYINSSDEPIGQLKQVLKVIKKYNEKEQLVHLFNGEDEDKLFNRLAVSLHLLEDYFQNGIYTNQHEVIETNGEGEILWDKTINETFAFIQNNRPYYVELQTVNSVDNEMDYIRCIHECVISQCSRELRDAGLLDLFELSEAELTNSVLDDFGDVDYIKYRLENEIKQQFVTRKQTLLKTLYTYISNASVSQEDLSYSLYGTNNFNLVWEEVCKHNFNNCLDIKLSDLPLELSQEYLPLANKKLIDIIDKPIWTQNDPLVSAAADTLKPDLVSIYSVDNGKDYCFGIFDAKYYCIDFKKAKDGYKVEGQPGVGDVTKQYLYQLAYEDFAEKQGYKYMLNVFLCPKEDAHLKYGFVHMKMLEKIVNGSSRKIFVVKLCAEEMFNLYLSNKRIEDVAKCLPDIVSAQTEDKHFTGRLSEFVYSYQSSGELELSEKMQKSVIYPNSIKRKVGAKLIYDVLYPAINTTFYSYNHDNVQKAASDNLSIKREQLAEAAIKFELDIINLPEEQFDNIDIVKTLLSDCFEGKEEIKDMLSENKLESICEQLSVLMNKLYT